MGAWTKYLPGFIRYRVETNPDLQNILSNSGWMAGDRVLRRILGLLVGVMIARYLGPQLYGKYSYALAVVMIVSPIAVMSMDAVSVRRIVQAPSSTGEVLGTSFFLMLGGGLLAFALATAGILVLRPDDRLLQGLVVILSAGAILQAFTVIEFWFFSQVQWKYSAFAKTSAFLLMALVKIVLVLLQAPLIAFAWAGLAETAFASAGLLLIYRLRGHSLWAWRFSRAMAGSMLKDSWPLVMSAFLTMVYLRIDQIMIGEMVGSEELGNYSLAVQFSEVWIFVPMVLCGSVFPAILEAENFSEELFYTRLQRLYSLVAAISYVFAIPVTLLSDEIIGLLFGPEYSSAGPLLALLVWTGLFTSLGAARRLFIVAKNWTRVDLLSIALGCGLNIVLNLLLIPTYGTMGAVFATLVSYWFTIHGSCFLFKPLRRTGHMMTRAMIYPKFW